MVVKIAQVQAMPEAINTLLIPIEELPPGSLGAIRRQVTENLITMVATQLKVSPDTLVARDIRPQDDLDWCSNTDFAATEVTTEIWNIGTHASNTGFQKMVKTASTTMGDQRWIAIYGVRDMRTCFATQVTQAITLLKITVGNSVKAIWDTSKLAAYKLNPVGVSPSVIVIPQNTQYQFEGYISGAAGTICWVSLEGMVVEPRGKVISP